MPVVGVVHRRLPHGEVHEVVALRGQVVEVVVALERELGAHSLGLLATHVDRPWLQREASVVGVDHRWKAGDKVVLNGFGLGETHLGAYGAKARVKGDWLVPLPPGLTARQAMAIGTAGYTRLMSYHRKPYKTQDGYIAILPYLNDHWKAFCEAAGRLGRPGIVLNVPKRG